MATLADDLIGNLLNAGGLVGTAFAQGRQNQLAEQQGQQQLQLGQAKLNALAQANRQAQQYQQDVQAYSANPTPQALSQLMAKYPDQADAIKKSYDVLDAPARESRLATLGSLYYAADNNRPDLAANQIGAIIKAEQEAGHDTSEAEQIQAGLQSSDDATKRAALTQLKAFAQAHLAIADPKFAEAIIGKPESYTLEPGAAHFKNGVMDAHSPFVKGEDGAYYNWDDLTKGGGPASGGGGAGSGAPFDPRAFFKSFVLPHEGGYAAHDANGAPVNMGVNQAANPGVDVKNLTADQAADIFATKYAAKAASMPPALAGVYADTAYINPARAEQFLKASGGDPNKFLALRQAWMNSLIAKDPAKYQPYAKAWANRNRDLGQYIQQAGSADAASGAPQPLIPGKKKDQYTLLSPQEAQQLGLPTNVRYQRSPTGQIEAIKGANGDAIDTTNGLVGPDFLKSLPRGRQALIQAIVDGRAPAPKPGSRFGEQLAEDAAQAFPGIDTTTFPMRQQARKDFTGNGKQAQVMAAYNRFAAHLNALWRIHQQLGGPNAGPFSGVVASVSQSFSPGLVKEYNTELEGVQGEFQKLTKLGVANEGEAQRLIENAHPAQSAEGRAGALRGMAELVAGGYHPIVQQWHSAFPERPLPVDVTPEARAIINNVIHNGTSAVKTNDGITTHATRTAVNPKTGQRLGLINGKWVPIK